MNLIAGEAEQWGTGVFKFAVSDILTRKYVVVYDVYGASVIDKHLFNSVSPHSGRYCKSILVAFNEA